MKKITSHPNARTTARVRLEIQRSAQELSNRQLALRFGLSKTTIGRWRKRSVVADATHAPQCNHFQKLTSTQVALVVKVKKELGLPLDELRDHLVDQYNLSISRAHLSRLLARAQLTTHTRLRPRSAPGKFKTYPPGFFHIDTTYLPKIDGLKSKALCAIERSTRWAYVEVVPRKTAAAASQFLQRLIQSSPIAPHTILTDNGTEFTSRLLTRPIKKTHLFDGVCARHRISHKLTPVKSPWTNGMVERFNRKLKDSTIRKKNYPSHHHMKEDLSAFLLSHNLKPNKLLGGLSPSLAAAQLVPT
jgi:transposase InsO family protein